MKKAFNFLFSTRLMAILFLAFAGAMAVATFIENDFGTPTARVLVYNAWWFETIMLLFVINFVGNIVKFNLLQPKKWVTLLFHLSFILIIIGAAITRYISYEGMVVIKSLWRRSPKLSRPLEMWVSCHCGSGQVRRA